MKCYIHVCDPGQVVEGMPLQISDGVVIRDVAEKNTNKQNTTQQQDYLMDCVAFTSFFQKQTFSSLTEVKILEEKFFT